jgi:carbon storage regulator
MLVLRRRKAEKIVVDGRIEITILQIKRNTISVGIEAPHDVAIRRGEIGPSRELDSGSAVATRGQERRSA